MILENKGAVFTIQYDSQQYTVPQGRFEVNAELGNHIIFTVGKPGWKECRVVALSKGNDNAIKPAITQAPIPEPVLPPVVEAPVVETPVVDEIIEDEVVEDESDK